MPRQFFKRWLPTPHTVQGHKGLRWLGPILGDPHLFHLNRHSVSTAVFIGLFCAFLPLPGHMPLVALFAILLRCNLAIALMLVWISNPLTLAPIAAFCYQIGIWVLDRPSAMVNWELSWDWLVSQGPSLIVPLITGSLLVGLLSGITGYLSVRILWRYQVASRWQARSRFRQSRSIPPTGK